MKCVCGCVWGVCVCVGVCVWVCGCGCVCVGVCVGVCGCVCGCVWGGACQMALVVKNLPANAGDTRDLSLICVSGRSPGGVHGNPFQYSYLENPMDRGACWTTQTIASLSQTRLSD